MSILNTNFCEYTILMGVWRATPVFAISVIFLMSVLLLGLAGYPSSQLNSENNIDINGNFLFSFANSAHADDEDDDRDDDDDDRDARDDDDDDEEGDDDACSPGFTCIQGDDDGPCPAGFICEEECDDGDCELKECETNRDDDGICALELFCGDNILTPPEECDDGPNNSDVNADACRTTCELPTCGDNVTDANESCDDGLDNGTPGFCNATCTGQEPTAVIEILGYDARDSDSLQAHDGQVMPAGSGGIPNGEKDLDERVAVYVFNPGNQQILFQEVQFSGQIYTYDPGVTIGVWNDATNLVPGQYSIMTDFVNLKSDSQPGLEPGETATIIIDLDEDLPLGQNIQFRITVNSGIFQTLVVIGQQDG